MAFDPNKKFLYFNLDTTIGEMDSSLCFPVSSFVGAETQTSAAIHLHFKGSKGTDSTIVRVSHDQVGLIKTFYQNLVNEINFGEKAFIKVHDYGQRGVTPSDVSFRMKSFTAPIFTLQDTDFIVGGDSLTFDSVQLTGIQTSSESFVDNDISLMTSAAIDDRINTAVAASSGVSVSDSTANTDFPVVFHDESNNLHDDTGAFEYNPSTGNLTVSKITGPEIDTDGNTITLNGGEIEDVLSYTGADITVSGTIKSTGSTNDYSQWSTSTNGAATFTTVDAAGEAAHFEINADGDITLDSAAQIKLEPASGNNILLDGAITVDGGSMTGITTLGVDSVSLTAIQTAAESFADNDTSLMTSAAIDDRINTAVSGAASGDMTGVDITVGTGLDISQSNTTSGDYSATINLDLTEVGVSGSANQLLTDDGDGTVTSEANATFGNDALELSSSVSGKPTITLTNSNTDAHPSELIFQKTATGADDDYSGRIIFKNDNDADELTTFAKIDSQVADASDGVEEGRLDLLVQAQGALRTGFSCVGNGGAIVDTTIGTGATSTTTVTGDLKVNSGNIYGKTDNDLLLRSDDDIALLLDGDNDGTSAVKITNGAGSNVVIIGESGSIYTAGEIDLGHLNDTTIARHPSGGKVTIEGNEIVTAGAVNVSSGSRAPIGMQIARRTITQAEANAMNSTPIEIVPAQGANTIIVPHEIIFRVDRASTQAVSTLNVHVHYADVEPGVLGDTVLIYIRRFMYNETGDRVIQGFAGAFSGSQHSQNLTNDVNHAVEVSFSTAATSNCFTSIDVFMLYHVIDIS